MGLIGALRTFIDRHSTSVPKITLDISSDLTQLPAAIEVAAYRIVMEGINNALRHADAENVKVSIRLEEDRLIIVIDDDGVGMSPDAKPGIGLASMQERAEELGGHFRILSKQPGAQFIAELPFVKE
jgi:signal transduction histidine kinase